MRTSVAHLYMKTENHDDVPVWNILNIHQESGSQGMQSADPWGLPSSYLTVWYGTNGPFIDDKHDKHDKAHWQGNFQIVHMFHTANLYTEKLLHTAGFHTQQAFTHSKPLHTEVFIHSKLLNTTTSIYKYTQKLWPAGLPKAIQYCP